MFKKGASTRMTLHRIIYLSILLTSSALLSGCVMAEKYEAEKARSLNFQRLLAQEEKRTAELDSEVKRVKREATELDAKNREFAAQVQAVREQMAKVQEDAETIKEAALLDRKAKEERRSATGGKAKKPDKESVISDVTLAEPRPDSDMSGKPSSTIHQVKPGETLFRISRRYGVELDKLRKWNRLPDDIIEVGQKLIVGQE